MAGFLSNLQKSENDKGKKESNLIWLIVVISSACGALENVENIDFKATLSNETRCPFLHGCISNASDYDHDHFLCPEHFAAKEYVIECNSDVNDTAILWTPVETFGNISLFGNANFTDRVTQNVTIRDECQHTSAIVVRRKVRLLSPRQKPQKIIVGLHLKPDLRPHKFRSQKGNLSGSTQKETPTSTKLNATTPSMAQPSVEEEIPSPAAVMKSNDTKPTVAMPSTPTKKSSVTTAVTETETSLKTQNGGPVVVDNSEQADGDNAEQDEQSKTDDESTYEYTGDNITCASSWMSFTAIKVKFWHWFWKQDVK